jgi:hypothetical protein
VVGCDLSTRRVRFKRSALIAISDELPRHGERRDRYEPPTNRKFAGHWLGDPNDQ